ncbi:hypothetical protein Taro_036892 [Colocasia esculenta]|uniref:Putative plant transposon protein domain-containing protein n=1 Tax=Colocasia esculenta TaxID=4460 RepID=A0A843WB51_COLES|nr:hypothetical protein [Colocasia esculenta]
MASSVNSGSLGGYSAEFLSAEQQERLTFVKTKVCGNKAVDVADLEKNGMHIVVAAMTRMQWMGITTFSEVSYPDLVKAFFVCLRTEADRSLVSSVKGIQIKIDHELLHLLFGIKTSGHSGVHTVDAQAKGLGIVGPGFRLRDGKLEINQLSALNRLLHFIVCQILVPRSATFSTCTKADSDMMFWAIQNQEINMAEVMMERMRFARDQIWDTKSKLNISLPYAHLLTKVFQHFGVDVSGTVVEKIGQAIRSRNLRKSGFSVVSGVWTKTLVAEGEPILGEVQEVQLEAVAAESEGPSAVAEPAAKEAATPSASLEVAAITEVAMETPVAEENLEVADSVRRSKDPLPTSSVAYVLRQVLYSIHSSQVDQNTGGSLVDQSVAPGHIEDFVLGEQNIEKEAASQDALNEDAPVNEEQFEAPIEIEEQVDKGSPSKKTAHKRQKKFLKKIHLKPILKRLDDQGAVLDSVNSAVSTVFECQASLSNDVFQSNVALKWLNKELSSMKLMLSEVLKAVGPIDPTPQEHGPSGPSEVNVGPSGQVSVDIVERPSGPSVVAPARPSGPSVEVQPSKKVPSEDSVLCQESGPEKELLNPVDPVAEQEDQAVAPEPPASSSLTTPAAPSPPSSSTAPPAPTTFKRPRSRSVSSPQPFSSQLASSPASFTIVPPPPSSPPQLPPASSSVGPSSSGSSTSETFVLPTVTLDSIFNPPTPPSFITIIPEGAQLTQIEIQDIKDEFEVAILRSVMAVGTHSHRTVSSSPVSKKMRLISSHPVSSESCYPPLWFSLSISNKQKLIYEEYLQKAQQSKIFSMTEAKTEEQWARSNKDMYSQFRQVQAARYPPREAPLPIFEWFQIHHKNLFGPFIQKEIKFIRQYQMYSNYCYVNRLPESQLGQFRTAIRALSSSTAHTESLQVDFATLVIPDVVFLLPLHALIMDSSVGTLIFERAARGHIKEDVLAPILSECERLSPEEWTQLYPLSAQQLGDLNASQASSNQPPLSPGEFLDANSLHLIRDSYLTWVERYKVFFALKQELRSLKIDYPLKIEAFLRFASFGSFLTYKLALGSVKYGDFISDQR